MCVDDALQRLKEQLLNALEEDDEDREAEATASPSQVLLADADALPIKLLKRCRVCALSAEEAGLHKGADGRLVETLLALRRGDMVSVSNEAAALGGLMRWLQWLRCWLPPGSRKNLDAAMDHLKERRLQASKVERRAGCDQDLARWPPAWACHWAEQHELLKEASKRLFRKLRQRTRSPHREDPYILFGQARREVAEGLEDLAEEMVATRRRCDGLARRWVRRYAEEAARSLWSGTGTISRAFRRSLREGGWAISEDVLDWSLLLKLQSEVARVLVEEEFQAATAGQTRWLELWEAQLEDAGCQALATAVAVLQQLQWCLSDQSWGSQGFRGLRWRCGEVVLWHCPAQGKTLDQGPTEPASQVEMPPGCTEDRSASLVAFLFLNTPAWKPEWGGALRCVLKTGVQREVWGDGGRLVLLEEVPSHASPELMPSSHAQTVLILRLHSERTDLMHERNQMIHVKDLNDVPDVEPGSRRRSARHQDQTADRRVQKEIDAESFEAKIEMTSHEVIALFETNCASAFRLD
ncbi:unnamed protein product [Durusdinium trenchii]